MPYSATYALAMGMMDKAERQSFRAYQDLLWKWDAKFGIFHEIPGGFSGASKADIGNALVALGVQPAQLAEGRRPKKDVAREVVLLGLRAEDLAEGHGRRAPAKLHEIDIKRELRAKRGLRDDEIIPWIKNNFNMRDPANQEMLRVVGGALRILMLADTKGEIGLYSARDWVVLHWENTYDLGDELDYDSDNPPTILKYSNGSIAFAMLKAGARPPFKMPYGAQEKGLYGNMTERTAPFTFEAARKWTR